MPHTSWGEGCIVFQSTKKIVGKVGFDYANDRVLFKENDIIKIYTPQQVDYFQISDKKSKKFNQYVSLTFDNNTSYQRKSFFEVILDGSISFLRKPNKKARNMGLTVARENEEPGSYLRIDKLCYDYFYIYQNELNRVYNFQKELLPLLTAEKDEIVAYIDEKDIHDFTPRNQMVLIHYYNILAAAEIEHGPKEFLVEQPVME